MANLAQRVGAVVTAAWSAGLAAWAWPQERAGADASAFAARQTYYEALKQLYRGTSLLDPGGRARAGLYAASRPLFNPTKRLVDFYVDSIYPGGLSDDGRPLPDGTPSAVPLADDTPDALRAAIVQMWQWSNWTEQVTVYTLYGAMTGNVLVEVSDDVDRGKVYLTVHWPGDVADLTLDSAGHVKAYTLRYREYDKPRQQYYVYSRQVDGERIRTFRDDRPYDYSTTGQGSAWDNPYGFVPAVWVRHRHVGSDYGAPAIFGSESKLDEASSVASMAADAVQKKLNAPAIFWTDGQVTPALSETKMGGAGTSTDEYQTRQQRAAALARLRSDFPFLKGPKEGRVDALATALQVGDAQPLVDWLAGQVSEDQPELLVWKELRQMSQVTGPAAARLVTDAARRLDRAQKMYDRGTIDLAQMAVAMGGMRFAEGQGGWARRTRQRQAFAGFGLDSYEAGQLDFSLLPRPLLSPTTRERLEDGQIRASTIKTLVESGYPVELAVASVDGLAPDAPELAAFTRDRLAAIQREQTLAQSDVPVDPALAGLSL